MKEHTYIAVAGTWEAKRPETNFALPNSAFAMNLETLGFVPASELQPFEWSTEVDGLDGKNSVWEFAGLSLFYYAVPPLFPGARLKPEDTLVIAFSHGAQVAFHAFAHGLRGRLITVNPPVRSDMEPIIKKGRPNMIRWVNLYGDWKDVWAVLGAMRDGHFGIRRQFELADKNILVKGAHGAALHREHNGDWSGWLEEVMK